MKHLYTNDDGELVAADTIEAAARYHDVTMPGYEFVADEHDGDRYRITTAGGKCDWWQQVPDDQPVTISDTEGLSGDPGRTKPAAEWAAEQNETMLVATTYV